MAWDWYGALTDAFKKRAGRCLINRYLGTFLENGEVLLDQLSMDGDISLRDVAINIAEINSLLEDSELPVEFVDGFIGELRVTIPWTNLMTENCFFAVDGLTVTMQVRQRDNPAQISASIFHSMCESFSAMDMAEECLRNEKQDESDNTRKDSNSKVLGVELLAQAIDSIFMRVKLNLKNTTFRIEFVPSSLDNRGQAVEIVIGKIIYSGEVSENRDSSTEQKQNMASSTVKRIFFENVKVFSDNFSFTNDDPLGSMMRSRVNSGNSDDIDEHQEPPLQLASFVGRQEVTMTFLELNHFGLPRSIREIELSLGGLILHVYPHQIYTLSQIISALTVMQNEDASVLGETMPRQNDHHSRQFENLLQQSMMLPRPGLPNLDSTASFWASGHLDQSSDFKPAISDLTSKKKVTEEIVHNLLPMPRITIKVSSTIALFLERDALVAKMGGEECRQQAMKIMRSEASRFFIDALKAFAHYHPRTTEFDTMLSKLKELARQSCVGLVANGINVSYEEQGKQPRLASVTGEVSNLSAFEAIFDDFYKEEGACEVIDILQFDEQDEIASVPQMTFTYTEAEKSVPNLKLKLRDCTLNADPGFYDRTYLIYNYSEMDPHSLPSTARHNDGHPPSSSGMDIHVHGTFVKLVFHVPRADLREPKEIGRFASTYWERKVHPETFAFHFTDMTLTLCLKDNICDPFEMRLRSDKVNVLFRETVDAQPMSLIRVRQSKSKKEGNPKWAASIYISVCLDDSQKLQGKYTSQTRNRVPKTNEDDGEPSSNYFVPDGENMTGGETDNSQNNVFLQQLKYIQEALLYGRTHNNVLVDVKLDEVSLIIPSKHVYEVLYNRLGNDLLLWQPEIYKVKEYLYDVTFPDHLEDPDLGFSTHFTRQTMPPLEFQTRTKPTRVTFPRDNSVALSIHTDTCVLLSVNQLQACIMSSSLIDEDRSMLLLGPVQKLVLRSIVGLEKDPEIVLFDLTIGQGEVRFGKAPPLELDDLHFNVDLVSRGTLDMIVGATKMSHRAWNHTCHDRTVFRLTSKILFDSTANLKTINLAFDFTQAALIMLDHASSRSLPVWATWMSSFFTVVEYPVEGYRPPAILTEMQFNVKHCSMEISTDCHPARMVITLGNARVRCNFLDTIKEVHIAISLEDCGSFLSKDLVDPYENSVCVADVDYLELEVTLREEQSDTFLDVSVSCELLRGRTCPDTIALLSDFFQSLTKDSSSMGAEEVVSDGNNDNWDEPIMGTNATEDIAPDIASAMEELIAKEEEEKKKEAIDWQRQQSQKNGGGGGAQVFFFPDENNQSFPSKDHGMTDSFYPSMYSGDEDTEMVGSVDANEEFCILEDEIGTGIVAESGKPTSKGLNGTEVLLADHNYCEPLSDRIDFLRPPHDFPRFKVRIVLKRLSIEWHLFGGNDFSHKRSLPINTRSMLLGADALPSEHFTRVSAESSPTDQKKTRGGPGRNVDEEIVIVAKKIRFCHEVYPSGCRESSRQVLIVPVFEVHDRHALSQINKMMHHYSSRSKPKQSNANMISIRCLHICPDLSYPDVIETCINVSVQPIRLNIDQDTLFFIMDFIGSVFPEADNRPAISCGQVVAYKKGLETVEVSEEIEEIATDLLENLEPDESPRTPSTSDKSPKLPVVPRRSRHKCPDTFIRSFVFSPEVTVRIDYTAKYVDLSQGALAGLLVGLTSLNCSELTLKSIFYQQGILGFDKLLTLLVTEWLADIRQNQIPRLLGGVGPMYSVLQLFQGIKDLILLPLEQYHKDGRLFRGLQKGANSFTSSTTMSFLDLTNKMLGIIRFAAELAFDIMAPESSAVQGRLALEQRREMPRRNQYYKPNDIREGVFNAIAVVREGVDETARALTEAASRKDRGGFGVALSGVLRQVPSNLIVRPLIVATEATSNVLEGVQGQVAPEMRLQEVEKWRRPGNAEK